jgi:hypothetical protein
MRKGFDQKLAKALRTDAETLFIHYAKVSPLYAPALSSSDPEAMRRRTRAAVDLLDGDRLRRLHDLASELMRHRTPEAA